MRSPGGQQTPKAATPHCCPHRRLAASPPAAAPRRARSCAVQTQALQVPFSTLAPPGRRQAMGAQHSGHAPPGRRV
eukprot:351010-Chlamydomonas_euryale.AAC.4